MKYVDYYKVLGVDRSATTQEISRAYKKLARKYHPDLNKSAGAEAKFKDLNEANEVLKNPETRKRYDTLGANWKHGAPFEGPPGWEVHQTGPGGGGLGGFSDFFEAFFGGRAGGRAGGRGFGGGGGAGGFDLNDLFGGAGTFRGGGGRASSPGQDMESTLTIELEDAYHGSKKTVELAGPSGARRYEVKIPKGIREGERIRLAGQGTPGRGQGRGGDLYLTVHLAPHPTFREEGDDLLVAVPVSAWDAALGCRVRVPTLDGEVHMAVPPGQSSGQRLRLRGKGMPRRGGGHGDLFAELKITVPRHLTPEQEELFKRLREIG
jgi:curved DNA-binding protein